MKFTSLLRITGLLFATQAFAEQPTLTVYTYDSFTSDWGAAPKLRPMFESQCQCKLKFVAFDDGITMFNRVRLEGKKTKADVVLGIDNFTQPEAEKADLFEAHKLPALTRFNWTSEIFYPYDLGQYAFIYNQEKVTNPPKSLKELVERQDLKVIYQDPRTSLVGKGLLFWINQVYGKDAEQAWQQLAKHTVTVGKGWSETYGAFLKGEADLVLSYTTSPLYHQWFDKTNKYVAASFPEGHLSQVESAAIVKFSQQKALAQQFLQFLLSPEAQQIISYHNVMQPIVWEKVDPAFKQMPAYPTLEFQLPDSLKVKQWLATWQQSVSK